MNKDNNKPTKRRPYARQACQRCRSMKVKCINNNDGSPCERCIKGNHECVYTERKKRTTKAKKNQQNEINIKTEHPMIKQENDHPPHNKNNYVNQQNPPPDNDLFFNDVPFNPTINIPTKQENFSDPQYDFLSTPTLDSTPNFTNLDNMKNNIDPTQDYFQPQSDPKNYMNNTHNMHPPNYRDQQQNMYQDRNQNMYQDRNQQHNPPNNDLPFLEFPTSDLNIENTPDTSNLEDFIFDGMMDDSIQPPNQSLLPYEQPKEQNWNRQPSHQFSPSGQRSFLPEPFDESRNYGTQHYQQNNNQYNNSYQPIPLPGVPFDVFFNRQHQKIMLSINSQQLQSFRTTHPIAIDCYRKLMSDLQYKSQHEKVEAVGSLVMLLVKYFTPNNPHPHPEQHHQPHYHQLTNKSHHPM